MCRHYKNAVHKKLSEQLAVSIEAMRKNYDKRRKDIEPFKPGDLVMLNGKNIRAKHGCKKLEDKMYGPFEVLAPARDGRNCSLKLPDSWRINPNFNISLLERYQGTDPKNQVIEIEAYDAGWEMESIISSGPSHDDAKKHG